MNLIGVRHADEQLLRDGQIVNDQVGQFVWSHADVQHDLLVVPERPLNVLRLSSGQRRLERLVQVEFQLRVVELLAHIDVPVRLRHHARYQPVRIVKVFIIDVVFVARLWQWSQEVGIEKVRLQLVVCQVIARRYLELWEDVGQRHVHVHRLR